MPHGPPGEPSTAPSPAAASTPSAPTASTASPAATFFATPNPNFLAMNRKSFQPPTAVTAAMGSPVPTLPGVTSWPAAPSSCPAIPSLPRAANAAALVRWAKPSSTLAMFSTQTANVCTMSVSAFANFSRSNVVLDTDGSKIPTRFVNAVAAAFAASASARPAATAPTGAPGRSRARASRRRTSTRSSSRPPPTPGQARRASSAASPS